MMQLSTIRVWTKSVRSNQAQGYECYKDYGLIKHWEVREMLLCLVQAQGTIIYVPSLVSANKVSIGINKFVNSGDGSIAQAEITLKRIE